MPVSVNVDVTVSLFSRIGGVAGAVGAIWAGVEAIRAIFAVPRQTPFLPGPAVTASTFADPRKMLAEAERRFGGMTIPALQQLLLIRHYQAIPPNPLQPAPDAHLFVPAADGQWVAVPTSQQISGALGLYDFLVTGDRTPLFQRAAEEERLLVEYLRAEEAERLERLRREQNGGNVATALDVPLIVEPSDGASASSRSVPGQRSR
ncbi:MAG: hypothetical protein HYV03_01315 [Deltaproteobacteria bacterium]|nr:hypothetical protein [Deltaproteobacteria bacterium]